MSGARSFFIRCVPLGVVPRNERGYEVPSLAADAVLVRGEEVLLIRRGNDPFEGSWALPGGFVEVGETVEEACRRELLEETGVSGRLIGLIGVYSDPERDPRGHVVSTSFLVRLEAEEGEAEVSAGSDAAHAAWHALENPPALAFDHGRILADARRMVETLRRDG